MPWYNAQQYCRKHHTDLATFESINDIRLETPFSYSSSWIGLWDDPQSWKYNMGNESNSWRWSATGETSKTGYHKWDFGNPDYYDATERCVQMVTDGRWGDADCERKSTFICYYENTKAKGSKPNADIAWIGLYRVPWTWSEKSPSLFRLWDSSNPKNTNRNQHCVATNASHHWHDDSCSIDNVFICHQVVKLTTIVRMMTVTDSDLTDSAINAQILQQLGALLTSQGQTDIKMQWKTLPKKEDKK
ncbi:hypothetical protein CHARACLAT_027001 [Characodon lateralis]|uniref:C-type lectin domain-containing protein n=1 Tax=Characodon lateralis TaxID=208331 RepID=A0ABU7DUJ4_9TELE|nr:hypothetical protein [Characodon lateralis]